MKLTDVIAIWERDWWRCWREHRTHESVLHHGRALRGFALSGLWRPWSSPYEMAPDNPYRDPPQFFDEAITEAVIDALYPHGKESELKRAARKLGQWMYYNLCLDELLDWGEARLQRLVR